MPEITQGQLEGKPHCPNCKKLLDGFSHSSPDTRPTPGDISICVYCGEILQFTDELMLIPADADNLAKADFIQLQRMNKIAAAIRKKRLTESHQLLDPGQKSV